MPILPDEGAKYYTVAPPRLQLFFPRGKKLSPPPPKSQTSNLKSIALFRAQKRPGQNKTSRHTRRRIQSAAGTNACLRSSRYPASGDTRQIRRISAFRRYKMKLPPIRRFDLHQPLRRTPQSGSRRAGFFLRPILNCRIGVKWKRWQPTSFPPNPQPASSPAVSW